MKDEVEDSDKVQAVCRDIYRLIKSYKEFG